VTYSTVSAGQAVSNALAVYVLGAILTFAPQGKTIKFAGAAVLGWEVFSDVRSSVSGVSTACPELRAGQYIKTTSWLTSSGSDAKYNLRHQVWESKANFTAGRKSVCNATYVAATYR
jgi:hypothetical protein